MPAGNAHWVVMMRDAQRHGLWYSMNWTISPGSPSLCLPIQAGKCHEKLLTGRAEFAWLRGPRAPIVCSTVHGMHLPDYWAGREMHVNQAMHDNACSPSKIWRAQTCQSMAAGTSKARQGCAQQS